VVVYNRILTSDELNAVGYYLAVKYSLTTDYTQPGTQATFAYWADKNGVTGEPNGDSNHDGVQNGIAYFMDNAGLITNPSLNVDNKVTWPMSATFSGRYEVQISTDLSDWQPAVPQPTRNGEGNLEYSLPSGAVGGKNFVRLLVTPTP